MNANHGDPARRNSRLEKQVNENLGSKDPLTSTPTRHIHPIAASATRPAALPDAVRNTPTVQLTDVSTWPRYRRRRRLTADETRSSVAVNATRTCAFPLGP